MAKITYDIPSSLDQSYLDAEISLKNKDGTIGLQAVPLRAVLCAIASFFGFMFAIQSFIGQGGVLAVFLFVVGWIAMSVLLIQYDKSRRMGLELVNPFLSYTKGNRRVNTRRTDDATNFYNIVGISSIDADGLITFVDKSYAYCYRVVGTASILLFERDKENILNRVDAYYRKVDPEVTHTFVTTKEPQLIHNQHKALKEKFENLSEKYGNLDPGFIELVDEQEKTLVDYVGGKFRTTHQYLILKGKNLEALQVGVASLIAELEASNMMFRQCISVHQEGVQDLLRVIFGEGRLD